MVIMAMAVAHEFDPEAPVIEAIRCGDRYAFAEFVRRHNEWVRGVCEKPRVKCGECAHRRFLPLTDEVIRWHLSGAEGSGEPFVAG